MHVISNKGKQQAYSGENELRVKFFLVVNACVDDHAQQCCNEQTDRKSNFLQSDPVFTRTSFWVNAVNIFEQYINPCVDGSEYKSHYN